MTLKKFKTRTKRKSIGELQQLEENLQYTLNLALQYFMESETTSNEDIKYLQQLGRKIKIAHHIINRKLEE